MQKPIAPPHTTSRPLAAIGLMVVTFGLFACLDATAKHLVTTTQLPLIEIVWTRFLGQLLGMIVVLGLVALPGLVRTRKPGLQIVRSFLLLGSTGFNFLALRHLQLDETTTINFLAPLAIALLAGPLLCEWIGWRRGVAIAVGFGGALIAIRPGFSGVHPAVLWALWTMLCMAFFGIVTRYLAAFDRAEVTLFYSLFAGTVVMAPFALADWVWPSGWLTWALLLSLGVYGGLGHYAFIVAHRYAPASTLAPFLPLAPHPLHRRLPGVRTGAGQVDAGRRRHRHPHRPLPPPPRARNGPRRRRGDNERGGVAAVGGLSQLVHRTYPIPARTVGWKREKGVVEFSPSPCSPIPTAASYDIGQSTNCIEAQP